MKNVLLFYLPHTQLDNHLKLVYHIFWFLWDFYGDIFYLKRWRVLRNEQ